MKQLELTDELVAKIKAVLGEDVDPAGFAVFEAISLNTKPLPGKRGTIFEKARVSFGTMQLIAKAINEGGAPLVSDHVLMGAPKGRVFLAQTGVSADGDGELRTLFFLDPTEKTTTAKLNSGVLDEVSVNFLAGQILCSECDFDYRGEDATWRNFETRTCANGHTIGVDGVHARLTGLEVFTELSLVTRGAASNPKIVGRSQSKLSPSLERLAASGFEVDQLYLTASIKGVNRVEFDVTQLVDKLSDAKASVATLTAAKEAVDAQVTQLTADLQSSQERITALETELAAAREANPEDHAEELAALAEAREYLGTIYTATLTATGATEITVPETIADLKAGIETHREKLTAILPIGGAAAETKTEQGTTKLASTTAFRVRR